MPKSPPNAPKGKPGSANKISNRLMALSSAAVLTVYTAGYLRTSAAADRLEASSNQRRTAAPVHAPSGVSPASASEPAMGTGAVSAPATLPSQPETSGVAKPESDGRSRGDGRQAAAPPAASATVTKPLAAPESVPAPAIPVAVGSPEPVAATAHVPAPVELSPPEVPTIQPAPAAAKYKDGTYLGWGTSRHGDIQAAVVIEGGRIVSATIAQCLTRYSCSWIQDLPPQVVKRQSAEVDYVSGATQSTNAFYYGIVEALAKAK